MHGLTTSFFVLICSVSEWGSWWGKGRQLLVVKWNAALLWRNNDTGLHLMCNSCADVSNTQSKHHAGVLQGETQIWLILGAIQEDRVFGFHGGGGNLSCPMNFKVQISKECTFNTFNFFCLWMETVYMFLLLFVLWPWIYWLRAYCLGSFCQFVILYVFPETICFVTLDPFEIQCSYSACIFLGASTLRE